MFFYIELMSISTTSGLWSTGNTRKYHQIDVYIYQYVIYGLAMEPRMLFKTSNHLLTGKQQNIVPYLL